MAAEVQQGQRHVAATSGACHNQLKRILLHFCWSMLTRGHSPCIFPLQTCTHLNCCRQLEVLRNNDDGGEKGSLLWLMDHTKTPFGGRLLRNWVAHPLTSRQRINERLDAVEEMVAAGSAMEQGSKPQFRQSTLTVPTIQTAEAISYQKLSKACVQVPAVTARSTADCTHV